MATRSSIGPATLVVFGVAILLIGGKALLGAWIWIGWVAAFVFLVDTGCRWLASNPYDGRQDLPPETEPEADWFWDPNRPADRGGVEIVDDDIDDGEETK